MHIHNKKCKCIRCKSYSTIVDHIQVITFLINKTNYNLDIVLQKMPLHLITLCYP